MTATAPSVNLSGDLVLTHRAHRAIVRASGAVVRMRLESLGTAWAMWKTLGALRPLLVGCDRVLRHAGLLVQIHCGERMVAEMGGQPSRGVLARLAARRTPVAVSVSSLARLAFGLPPGDTAPLSRSPVTKNASEDKQKERTMSEPRNETRNWPELAIGLYDKLTGRGAEITYEFENFEVAIPSRAGAGAEHANWKVNGGLRIRTADQK